VIDERDNIKLSHDPHAPLAREIQVRFYAELNDFLPAERRHSSFEHEFTGTPSVLDTIEAIGVPHTEVDVILVNDQSVGFGHRLYGGERVAVYPTFERFDVSPLIRLRPRPLRVTRFVADVHLGTLARYLRLLGIDTTWQRDLDDETIIDIAAGEKRIILTRDKGILRDGRVTHGYWVRATDPMAQLHEVIQALDLARSSRPYRRCMECNGGLQSISRFQAYRDVPLQVFLVFRDFNRCESCGKVYWRGSHEKKLNAIIEHALLNRS
jgi:uncharacterized protein with PIN domain